MNRFKILWAEILYRPIFNLLVIFLAIFWGNLGLAIVFLTLVVRFALIKTSVAGANMGAGMSKIQPKMEEIQKKYADNPEKISEETMKLLKKEGGAPLKGCLGMLVQLPVFIWLFFVVRQFVAGTVPVDWLYSFFWSFGNKYLDVANINANFLGINLFETGNWILTGLVAILNYIQFQLTSLTQKNAPAQNSNIPGVKMPDMSKMMGMMNIMMTAMMATFVYSVQSAVGIYILTTSVFSIVQYSIQYRVLLRAKWDSIFHKDKPQIISK